MPPCSGPLPTSGRGFGPSQRLARMGSGTPSRRMNLSVSRWLKSVTDSEAPTRDSLSALADSRLTGDPTFLMGCWCERFQMHGPAITVIRQLSRLSSRQILREFDSLRGLDEGASHRHAIYHHTHLSDVQLSYSTRHPKLSFYCHGKGHVSNPQRPSPTESRKLHLSFQPIQPAPRRHQRTRTDCADRIASHIGQSDIPGKATRSARHLPGVCDFLLFRDGILSVYHI